MSKIAWSCLLGSAVVLFLRASQAKVVTNPAGVEVSNPFSRYKLAWSEIECFELGRWKLNSAMCLIRLHDGETKPAAGVFLNNAGFGGGDRLVLALNEELRRFAGGSAPPRSPESR